ncbi:MAG: Bax inhibitor-1/YccA family protein [Streptococcaceae bacterium]|jgi:FtsH-binding integral membrane protein|nr:Bax inhibitor-1/YccA family protein [Streptococcaceae bacterium]
MDNNNVIYDERQVGLNAFFNKIYALVGMGILLSAAVAWITITFFLNNLIALFSNSMTIWILMIGMLVLMIPMNSAARRNSPAALPLYLLFAAVWGFVLSITLLAFTQTAVTAAFISSAAVFFGMSAVGRITKRDLSGMRKALTGALIGLIVAMLLNVFIFHGGFMQLVISVIGVLIFAAFTAYDNNRIKQVYNQLNGQVGEGWAVAMAFSLYLDFINLFMFLLQIFGGGGASRR